MNYQSCFVLLLLSITPLVAESTEWGVTEIEWKFGKTVTMCSVEREKVVTFTTTMKFSGDWKYGEFLLFADVVNAVGEDYNVCFEAYPTLSLNKVLGRDIDFGYLEDVALVAGYNFNIDAKFEKYLPGVRMDLDVPGFSYVKTDFLAYLDGSEGLREEGVSKESHAFMFNVSWKYPFYISKYKFSFEGRAKYVSSRTNELGQNLGHLILAQPRFIYEVNSVFKIGVEPQFFSDRRNGVPVKDFSAQLFFSLVL